MIDMSKSMQTTYLKSGEKKLKIAIQASKTAINSLNPNDNVSDESVLQLPHVTKPTVNFFTIITSTALITNCTNSNM